VLYIVTGRPYAGKTVLSRELVRRLGFGYASVDDHITAGGYDVTAMDQPDWNRVYSLAFERLEEMLLAGRTVVFDGASLTLRERQSLRAIAAACGADAMLVYVNTSADETARRRNRAAATQERAQLADVTMLVALAMFEEPAADEQPVVYHAGLDLDQWIEANIRT